MKITFVTTLASLSLFAFSANAQTFEEDFSDPVAFAERWVSADGTIVLGADGTPTGEILPGGPGIVGVENGKLVQRTTAPVPLGDPALFPPGDLTVLDLQNGGTQQTFVAQTLAPDQAIQDVIVRTKVRVDTQTNAAIGFRGSVSTFSNYNVTAAGAIGKFAIARIQNGVMDRVEIFDEPTYGVGEDWWMEASAIGDQITLKVWQDGSTEPSSPQFNWTDDAISEGGIGLGSTVWNNNIPEPTMLNATFDDFSYQVVPEPSGILMLVAGMMAMLFRRSLRQ